MQGSVEGTENSPAVGQRRLRGRRGHFSCRGQANPFPINIKTKFSGIQVQPGALQSGLRWADAPKSDKSDMVVRGRARGGKKVQRRIRLVESMHQLCFTLYYIAVSLGLGLRGRGGSGNADAMPCERGRQELDLADVQGVATRQHPQAVRQPKAK